MNTLNVIIAIILIITELPAEIFLVHQWIKACREANKMEEAKQSEQTEI